MRGEQGLMAHNKSKRLSRIWSGSNPGVDAICGLSLLLALFLVPRSFSPGTAVFPSPQKPTFPNSNSTTNQVHVHEEPLHGYATSKSLFIHSFIHSLIHLFICSFIYLFTYFHLLIYLFNTLPSQPYSSIRKQMV